MRKKLTVEQKLQAIQIVLFNALNELSATAIGRKIGFSDGAPIQDLMEHLVANGRVDFAIRPNQFGQETPYYMMTSKGREFWRSQGWQDDFKPGGS